MSAQSPAVARLRLRHALRSARESSDYTQEQVASELDWSLSKVIRIENGTVRMTVTDVRALMQLYGIDDASEMSEMESLVRASRQRSWWTQYGSEVMSGRFATYIGLEDGASALAMYQALVVPGLLQTEAYARAVDRRAAHARGGHPQPRDVSRHPAAPPGERAPAQGPAADPRGARRGRAAPHQRRRRGAARRSCCTWSRWAPRRTSTCGCCRCPAGIHTMESTFVLLSFPFGRGRRLPGDEQRARGDPDRGQFLDRGEVAAPYRDTFTMLTGAAPERGRLAGVHRQGRRRAPLITTCRSAAACGINSAA